MLLFFLDIIYIANFFSFLDFCLHGLYLIICLYKLYKYLIFCIIFFLFK